MTQATIAGVESSDVLAARDRELEHDPTPRGLPRAVLPHVFAPAIGELRARLCRAQYYPGAGGPFRVLDVCAGFGCWASEVRRLLAMLEVPVHVTGVEIDPSKREHLAKWCDDVVINHWRPQADPRYGGWSGDLVIGNPAFSQLLRGDAGQFVAPEQTMPAVLLRQAPAVLLLHTQQAFLKSEAGRACWRAYPPAASWLVPGGVKFRGAKVGADSRCYQVTLWLRGHKGPCVTRLLADLAPHERAWVVPPGSEDPSADLPAAPGWAP